jgi:hypothetical protein
LGAPLQPPVPPLLGGRSFTIGPFYAKPELLIGFFNTGFLRLNSCRAKTRKSRDVNCGLLGDNAVSARGVLREGERLEGSPIDFSLFNRSYDDDDIAEKKK